MRYFQNFASESSFCQKFLSKENLADVSRETGGS